MGRIIILMVVAFMLLCVSQVSEACLLKCKRAGSCEPTVTAVQEPVVEQVASAPEVQEEEPDWTVRYVRGWNGLITPIINEKYKDQVTQERIDKDTEHLKQWYAIWDAMSEEEKDTHRNRWEEDRKSVRTVAAVNTGDAEVKQVSNVVTVQDEVVQSRCDKRCCRILHIFKRCR